MVLYFHEEFQHYKVAEQLLKNAMKTLTDNKGNDDLSKCMFFCFVCFLGPAGPERRKPGRKLCHRPCGRQPPILYQSIANSSNFN